MLTGSDNAPQKASEAAQKDAISGAKDAITMEVSKSFMDNYNGPNAEKKDIQKLVQDAAKTAVETTRKNNKFLIDPTGVDGNIITLQTESYCVTGEIDERGAIMWSDAVASTAKPIETTNMYAVLYTDGTLAFSQTDKKIEGKEVKSDYGNIKDEVYTTEVISSDTRTANTPWYSERESIKIVNFADEIIPISTSAMFYGCKNLTEIQNIQNLNTEKVTDMNRMFGKCKALTNIDVSHFDTRNVTNMYGMFLSCKTLKSIDVSSLNTSQVTDMGFMFAGNGGDDNDIMSLTEIIGLEKFDTSNVTDMKHMFADLITLESLNIDGLDTSKVTNMYAMFCNCKILTIIDASSFNTSQVTNMDFMFADNPLLQTIYVGDGWTTQNATTSNMFIRSRISKVTKKGQ